MEREMFQCTIANCAYIYDTDRGDKKGKTPKGVAFINLPENWLCPICGASKKSFQRLL